VCGGLKKQSAPTISVRGTYSNGQIVKAWSPFIILTLVILTWGLQQVKDSLDSIGLIKFNIPGLHNIIRFSDSDNLLPQTFKFNYLSTPGTAILISAFICLPLVGLRFSEGVKIFFSTVNQIKIPDLNYSIFSAGLPILSIIQEFQLQ